MVLGQTTSQRVVILSREEAEAFSAAGAEVSTYIAENFSTATNFCQGSEVVAMTSRVATVSSKIRRQLTEGIQGFQIDQDTMLAANRLAECAIAVTRHLGKVTLLSMAGTTLTAVGGIMLKVPILAYVGLGVTIFSQVFGPSVKIPLLE